MALKGIVFVLNGRISSCCSRCPIRRAAGTVHSETPAVLHALRLPGLCDGPQEQGGEEGHTQRIGGICFHQQRCAG